MDVVNELACRVQYHVPQQPWGRWGDAPVPVELWFDAGSDGRSPHWRLRFVTGLKNGKRTWGHAEGKTVEAALAAARELQDRV